MEETIARIRSHKGVEGVMIMNRRGAMNWPTIFSTYLNSDMPEILEYRRWIRYSRLYGHHGPAPEYFRAVLNSVESYSLILVVDCHFSFHISGAIIQSTLDEEQTTTHAAVLSDLTAKASHIVGMLNQDDELTFLRIRSKQREIMVSHLWPARYWIGLNYYYIFFTFVRYHWKVSPDKEFILVVLQNPNLSE